MVVETGVIVCGLGYSGAAIARELFAKPHENAPVILLDKKEGEMVVDVILGETGAVAGALVARNGRVEPIRAPAVILATGGSAGLFPGGDWLHSGDGLAIAHRAGVALSKPHVVAAPHADDAGASSGASGSTEVRAGVPCKPDGATILPGLFVSGSLGADKPDPARVARAAITRSREGAEPFGPYAIQEPIDAPLPDGFADVKFDRLHAITGRALAGNSPREETLAQLHRLKGEADEFARARVDLKLYSLRNACEVAVLLFRSS